MLESLLPQRPPVHLDDDGVLRVGGTRVTLDTVVGAYQDGASPEEIVLAYDALELDEVYGALSFYLRRRTAVEAYLTVRRQQADAVRAENQRRFPTQGVRERLLARRR
ncbi:MAG: DUF433 domain-containing protein, partial [Armatimonadetes bacterium]|nr:DUF433 domain-containing protein [Armatimonadota bacterium]